MTLTLRAKSPEDLLAAIPVTLGFEPQDSIVMLTFGAATPLHARIDLPPRGDPAALEAVARSLLDACRRNPAARAVFVLYGSGAMHCRHVARRLRREFERVGIEVVECLRADAGRWYSADGRRPDVPARGMPYDSDRHPFRAQAVMAGHVTLGSRAELAASVAADPQGCAAVRAVLADAAVLSAAELAALCQRHVDARSQPSDVEVAAMLLTLQLGSRRDAAWATLTRETAEGHVALWRAVVSRAPESLMPSAAAVLAFAAWLHGDGALAWCALDRCLGAAPQHGLGTLVAAILAGALPPSAWAPMRAAMGELTDDTDPEGLAGLMAQAGRRAAGERLDRRADGGADGRGDGPGDDLPGTATWRAG